MKKKILIYLMMIIGIMLIIGGIIYSVKVSNNYYELSKITDINLDNLYIRGRASYYDAALNYLYGDKIKAKRLSNGSTSQEEMIYYDEKGKEKLKITFIGNQNQVKINKTEYLYKENNKNKHKTKELYPNKDQSECEKMIYNIIKLYDKDDYYVWDYYTNNDYEYPDKYTKGVIFRNAGFEITVLEYKDNSIDEDYEKECERIISSFGASLESTNNTETKKINNYIGGNDKFTFTVIKYNKLIITIGYSNDYIYEDPTESKNNIDLLNKYLKEQNII